jgi:hypothetical protein
MSKHLQDLMAESRKVRDYARSVIEESRRLRSQCSASKLSDQSAVVQPDRDTSDCTAVHE